MRKLKETQEELIISNRVAEKRLEDICMHKENLIVSNQTLKEALRKFRM
jgi:hypothetical protein